MIGLLVLVAAISADPMAVQPEFTATGPTDERPTGALVKLTQDATAELATPSGPVVVPVISLRRESIPTPPFPRGPVLITTTGDRLPGRLVGGDDQVLRYQVSPGADAWEIPLTSVAAVWVTRPPADTPVDPARYSWLTDQRNRDTIRLPNGDTVTGTLDGFTAASALRIRTDTGTARELPIAEVSALCCNPSLGRPRKPKGPYARVALRNGTRLALTSVTADADSVRGKTLFGRSISVPLAELVALDVIGGKAVYIADLKPTKVEQAGFFGREWPWAADRTVRGSPLQLATPAGEATFDRGLGTHPRTVLTYALGRKYQRFDAIVGLDAGSGNRGRAVGRVLVDGREVDLPGLRQLAAGVAVPVRVDVRGAKELTLAVDFSPTGDVQADVDWADARLVE